MSTYEYKFELGKEILNFLLHVLVGGIVAHTFLVYLPLVWIIILLIIIGAGREIWQNLKGKKQPWWISTIDSLSFGLGGYLWWLIINHFNINAGFL